MRASFLIGALLAIASGGYDGPVHTLHRAPDPTPPSPARRMRAASGYTLELWRKKHWPGTGQVEGKNWSGPGAVIASNQGGGA